MQKDGAFVQSPQNLSPSMMKFLSEAAYLTPSKKPVIGSEVMYFSKKWRLNRNEDLKLCCTIIFDPFHRIFWWTWEFFVLRIRHLSYLTNRNTDRNDPITPQNLPRSKIAYCPCKEYPKKRSSSFLSSERSAYEIHYMITF